MKIYLVRHGETGWNRIHKLQGQSDIELNDVGRELAEVTAEGLKDIDFGLIYSSPLNRAYETVKKYGTAIVSVPSKDTVKIVDEEGLTLETPDRKSVWLMQTPQVFAYGPILEAYERMSESESKSGITDDAMVMEEFGDMPVHVTQGSYRNIKITTPEDMLIAEAFLP